MWSVLAKVVGLRQLEGGWAGFGGTRLFAVVVPDLFWLLALDRILRAVVRFERSVRRQEASVAISRD